MKEQKVLKKISEKISGFYNLGFNGKIFRYSRYTSWLTDVTGHVLKRLSDNSLILL